MNYSGAQLLRRLSLVCAMIAALLALPARAQTSPVEDNAKPGSLFHYGLLRERDLTPFGFLRLEMRPAHTVSAPQRLHTSISSGVISMDAYRFD